MSAGVRIIEAPDLLWGRGRTGWDLWNVVNRIARLRGEHYDLVHGYESRPVVALPALYLQRTRGIPTILGWADWYGRGGTAHERGRLIAGPMAPIETFCEEYFHPLADGCVAMGEPLVERALSVGIPRERILNLLHGCDPEGMSLIEVQEARRNLPELPQEGAVLGYLGVLRPRSAELLFHAFEVIKSKVSRPCKLILIGNHKLRLSDYLPEDLEDDIIETGWLSYEKLNLYLAASDVLLLPFPDTVATNNIWPSKFNDYLAAGRPTVGTDMRVLKPIFEKYEVGVLTEPDSAGLAEGCLRLLEDELLHRRMGDNARRLAEGDLSWTNLVDRLETFYFDLVESMA
jgi:glycosyltransferase involved in cell wall biosynthesis